MKYVKIKNINLGQGKPKICVSLVGKTESEIIRECKNLSSKNIDIVEFRCDFFEYILNTEIVCDLLKQIKIILNEKPLIFTVRSKEEGGEICISQKDYINLYNNVCQRNLTDVIDVELRLGDENIKYLVNMAHNNNIKVIISKHDFKKTPKKSEMLKDLTKMQELEGDILKLAVMPNSNMDVIKLLEVTTIAKEKYNNIPIITISMGQKGIISRMSGQIFGSCLTFASGMKASAPGQISIKDLDISLEMINKYYGDENKLSNIILIGFMGTGKSCVSEKLSEILKMKKIDTDEHIEKKENKTIDNIFSDYGEDYFRQCEKNVLIDLFMEKNIIISCGGGIIVKDENIELIKKMGKVVLLTASPQIIYERVRCSTNRPILNKNMNEEYISTLIEKRKNQYLKAADIIINTDDKSIDQICQEIINNLK